MNYSEDTPEKSSLSSPVIWLALLVTAYPLGTGPITRWHPKMADMIYAPLSPIAHNKALGKPLQLWLRLWGVKTI